MAPRLAPYGAWPSPITARLVAQAQVGFQEVHVGTDAVWWIESRPAEAGRCVILRRDARETVAITPAPFSARTRVHEYGGGAMTVADGSVYFAHFPDQRLYRIDPGGAPVPITPAGPQRYADFSLDAARERLIAVQEDHTPPAGEPVNAIVAIDVAGNSGPRTLVAGHAFFAAPRLSPDGTRLAWLAWDYPQMPWDGTELWVATITGNGGLENRRQVAGGPGESIDQPAWAPDGTLTFLSDRSGWWNLYEERDGAIRCLHARPADFGAPAWVFSHGTYDFLGEAAIACAFVEAGAWRLGVLDRASGALREVPTPFTDLRCLRTTFDGAIVAIGGAPDAPATIARIDAASGAVTPIVEAAALPVARTVLPTPEAITFPATDSANSATSATSAATVAHAFFYPPTNPEIDPPDDARPPLIVISHGGPTSAATTALNWRIAYWTSRGFAVVNVNYRGSSGYGRAYRDALKGRWGIVDVDDCIAAARFMADTGRVDGARMAITGGSAGGYTTLCALTFHDVFAAGASYYGVSDLEALARDTHKFESRYLDSLVGPYPEQRELYVERSPVHAAERLNCPVIFLQGLEDAIVPPNQAERMVQALRRKGVPVAYLTFPGEQHGFRQAATIQRALEAELYFYGRVFGFTPADVLEPVPIANLAADLD